MEVKNLYKLLPIYAYRKSIQAVSNLGEFYPGQKSIQAVNNLHLLKIYTSW